MVGVSCTKCNSIDNILEGGFRSGHITEICGDEGTGKTQICLQLMLAAQLDEALGGISSFAVYVTSVGHFPAGRLAEMVPHVFGSIPPEDLNPLKRILVKQVESPYELIETLQWVEELVKGDGRYRVVVIDSVPSICHFHFHNTRESMKERTSIVNVFSSGLRSLAEKYDLVVVAVNETVKVNPNEQRDFGLTIMTNGVRVQPALGKTWNNNMSTRLFVEKKFNEKQEFWERTIRICCSPVVDPDACHFKINGEGVVDV